MALELPYSLTPSKITSFKDCPKKFQYTVIDHLPEPPSSAATKGSLVHRALELLFWLPKEQRTNSAGHGCLDVAQDEFERRIQELELEEKESKKFYDEARVLLDKYFYLEDPRTIDPVGIELLVQLKVGSITLRGIIDRLDYVDGKLRVVDYKGLALDTPLATPDGWTTMGAVRVGDSVFDSTGLPVSVTEKSAVHHRPCYRIILDDGSSIIADNEHLWVARVNRDQETRTISTEEMYQLRECGPYVRKPPITILNTRPLQLQETTTLLDPYVLGIWLGDGHSRKGTIHVHKDDSDEVSRNLENRGERILDSTSPSEAKKDMRVLTATRPIDGACLYGHVDRRKPRPDGRMGDCIPCMREKERGFPSNGSLYARLSYLGLIGREPHVNPKRRTKTQAAPGKRVPQAYLRTNQENRIELLRGLMDADGHWNPLRKQCVFSNTNPHLVEAVEDLVAGLGMRYYTYSEEYESTKGPRLKFMVHFTPVGFNPFHLKRKKDACTVSDNPPMARRRAINSVVPISTVPTQCIAVDSPTHTYLAGRQMVPTHNTGKAPSVNWEQGKLGGVHFYAFMCERILGVRPDEVSLLYLADPVEIVAHSSKQSTRGLSRKVTAIWDAIERACEREDFRPRPSRLCNWCSFREICPAWQDPAGT